LCGYEIDLKIYKSGSDLLFDLEEPKFHHTLDILLLDIGMPGLSGVETAVEARKIGYEGVLIFVTADNRHYEEAFDVMAFNYVVKGDHSAERFIEVFSKALSMAAKYRNNNVIFSNGSDLCKISIDQITYFEIIKGSLTVRYNGQKFEIRSTLEKIEEELSDRGFQRIHRNYIVSLTQVRSITYSEVIMQDGTSLPVGRRYYPELKSAVERITTG